MKVRIAYTLDLTQEQEEACVRSAQSCGFGYDNPNRKTLLKRLFQDMGESVILKAIEDKRNEDEYS